MDIYIPIELWDREFESRCLLASKLLNLGFTVILGKKNQIFHYVLTKKNGIFFGIWGAHKNFLTRYTILKKNNFLIFTIDEEGLITLDEDTYKKLRCDKNTLNTIDCYFSWSEYHKKIIKSVNQNTNCIVSSNPRLDITKKNNKISNTRVKKILFISSFALSNHYLGSKNYLIQLEKNKVIVGKKSINQYKKLLDFQEKNQKYFLEAVNYISNQHHDYDISLKIHPSENEKYWVEKLNSNVRIIKSGSIMSKISDSDIVIHNYCTSAVEAYAQDKISIAFRPFKSKYIECHKLPYIVSLNCYNKKNLKNYLQSDKLKILVGQIREKNKKKITQFVDINLDSSSVISKNIYKLSRNIKTCKNANFISMIFYHLKFKLLIYYSYLRRNTYVDHKSGNFSLDMIIKQLNFLNKDNKYIYKKVTNDIIEINPNV